ncbi:MAG: hypothetical protein U5K72_07515 [Balneolaceae bacterium]|nr:hypothetical protein [Balneolaceae bacterium]
MKKTKFEKGILDLPPKERERVALTAWESLEKDSSYVADRSFDPEGIDLALARDNEIESGRIKSISHSEFRKSTNNNNE